jgi:hypothetical protein
MTGNLKEAFEQGRKMAEQAAKWGLTYAAAVKIYLSSQREVYLK